MRIISDVVSAGDEKRLQLDRKMNWAPEQYTHNNTTFADKYKTGNRASVMQDTGPVGIKTTEDINDVNDIYLSYE